MHCVSLASKRDGNYEFYKKYFTEHRTLFLTIPSDTYVSLFKEAPFLKIGSMRVDLVEVMPLSICCLLFFLGIFSNRPSRCTSHPRHSILIFHTVLCSILDLALGTKRCP